MLDSKIDLLDPPEVVTKKIKKAVAVPKVVEENGILAFTEFVLLPAAALSGRREIRVERERDGLEPLVYTRIDQMHADYKNDVVRNTSFGLHKIVNTLLVDTPVAQTCRNEGPDCTHGAYTGSISSFQRMARGHIESIPATAKKGKEGQKFRLAVPWGEGRRLTEPAK